MSKSYNGSGQNIGDAILKGLEDVIGRTITPRFESLDTRFKNLDKGIKELDKKTKGLAAEMAQVKTKLDKIDVRALKKAARK